MTRSYGQGRSTKGPTESARVQAMLRVSQAVAGGGPLGTILDQVAAEASTLARAQAASILQLSGDHFTIVGSRGLSRRYRQLVEDWPTPLSPGRGPAGIAVATRAPVTSRDATVDKRFVDFADLVRGEGFRALASLPLIAGGETLGTLTLYRSAAGEWSEEEVKLLTFFAGHAATAVQTAQLIAERQRQVEALEAMVRRLRAQTHEHANRIQAIAGMLALGDTGEALSFVRDLTEAYSGDRVIFDGQKATSALAGLLWVETILARQRSIELRLNIEGDLDRLPLTDPQALTVVGNLLDNALDAVGEMSGARRRVEVTISEHAGNADIRVRDWGRGLTNREQPFASGFSTKEHHSGVGLTLTRETVQAVGGEISVEQLPDGCRFVVRIPSALALPGNERTDS